MKSIRRREFLRQSAALSTIFLPGVLTHCGKKNFSTNPSLPNIIFITADDLGWHDLGCYGNTDLKTPHIDRLAQEGARFTNAFVVSSSCSPSRASFITGQYPHTNGVEQSRLRRHGSLAKVLAK